MTISTRTLIAVVVSGVFLSGIVGVTIAKKLASAVSSEVQNRIVQLVFDSIEAGPLTFARLQSSSIADSQLSRLMSTPALSKRGILSVKITGGPKQGFTFASWKSDQKTRLECIGTALRKVTFSDSIDPYYVSISIDKCAHLAEATSILEYSRLATFSVLFIVILLLLGAAWPMISDVRNAEKIVEGNRATRVEKLRLESMRSLVTKALRAADAERQSALNKAYRQVAHDIRSPLSALNLLVSSLGDLPEDKRNLMKSTAQRINDIANGLLRQSRTGSMQESKAQVVMLISILDSIVSEKREQYRMRSHVTISSDFGSGYGYFCQIDTIELGRTISNLINNSVEAIENTGTVSVTIRAEYKYLIVEIADNGNGIPPELLQKLGRIEVSVGKSDSGFGLGVLHAKQTIEKAGGIFEIISKLGRGTTVRLKLPKVEPPKWFLASIKLQRNDTVVTIDDDNSIHEIWKAKLITSGAITNYRIQHVICSSISEANSWLEKSPAAKPIFLVDYEFKGSIKNGLDFLAGLEYKKSATLVSSHCDELDIHTKATQLGIYLLNKNLAHYVPIQLV